MDTQAIPSLDLWPYVKNAAQFMISYPYFYLFPVITIARNAALATSTGSEKLSALVPDHEPNFFTAFIFPLKPFGIWVIEKVLREALTAFLRGYLGFLTNVVIVVLCAPLTLMRTWAIVRGNRSSVRGLVESVRSLSFASWRYYIGTLLACEVVELLIFSPTALPLTQSINIAQEEGVIPRQRDEETPVTSPVWILTSLAALIGSTGIVVLLEWFPSNVVCVRAALSLLDPG
ncbi:hypothetical protein CEP52_011456 [Fusarium oligoseptatum]|uniref:Uncharacterized protein n=1 Tax=Fusarium oligoseptatum TaxID=2604345 RepID=A0A428T326_9HYPO|nr:hypothetical protein CEP52_011456 [Fusarium oligoseptatum]